MMKNKLDLGADIQISRPTMASEEADKGVFLQEAPKRGGGVARD